MQWITAINLQQWADTLQARAIFPALIADLVRASVGDISGIRFPNGDKGQVRGFDGVLDSTGASPYVPEGRSIWEFGVTDNAAAKAQADYKKRTHEVDEEVRKNTTFVFVSPRTWDNPGKKLPDWVQEKRNQAEWKSVEYFDGSIVEDWLGRCPAVAARYAKYELKLMPSTGARSTDEYWEEYSSRFSPHLVEEVLLAGRESQAKEFLEKLNVSNSTLAYSADSPDEVIAFAIAAIRRSEPAVRLYLEARTLVVDSEESARQLARERTGRLIFLPRAQARGLSGLLSKYGATVVSAGADEKRSKHEPLNRPHSTVLGKAFVAMGFTEQEGYDIARRCGRSLAVLARQKPSGTAERPEWMDNAEALLPALLAGAWSSSGKTDQTILCKLGKCDDYDAVEAPLRRLTKLKDPPVDHISDVWAMRASVDAFVHLGHLVGPEHLHRFSAAVTEVFSYIAPMPKADDVYRPLSKREEIHSGWLRDGMMNTLLHMAVLHEQAEFTVRGTTPQEFVDSLVRSIPGLSSDYRLLASLQDNLALLAEAAPIPFLEALERLLEGNAEAIKPIFEQYKGFISPQSFHLGVLWALETLAWDPKLLLRSSLCLARLAAIDPGGTVSNRPINSLRSIFLTWAPNTGARTKERLGVLVHLIKEVPTIAWLLLAKLLPQAHDTSSSTAKPKFREFIEVEEEVLTYGLVWESQAAVIELTLSHVGYDSERWGVLIGAMHNFQPEPLNSTLVALDKSLAQVNGEVKFKIWDTLRKEANRHKVFADTDWALQSELITKIDIIIDQHKPDDPLLLCTWLFDDWTPNISGKGSDVDDLMAVIDFERINALRLIIESKGIEGVVQFAKMVKLPQPIATTIILLGLSRAQLSELLYLTVHGGDDLDFLSILVVADGVARFGEDWVSLVRKTFAEFKIDSARAARLLTGLEETKKSWEIIGKFSVDVSNFYWLQKRATPILTTEDLLFAVEKYLSFGRPIAAIEASRRRLSDLSSDKLLYLLDRAVSEINISESQHTIIFFCIKRIFEELEKRQDVTPNELAKRELIYLPCFNNREKPLTLHRLIVEHPELFIDAICAVFKPKKAEARDISEGEMKLAKASYELLESLRILPGQTDQDINVDMLVRWCTDVRRLAEEKDRSKIADLRIGYLLAHAPSSPNDHVWPHESVRTAIESIASDELERGVAIERYNMRGVYTKALEEGGDQERELARKSREWANAMPGYPRTAAMLQRISEDWDRDAEEADLGAAKEALRN